MIHYAEKYNALWIIRLAQMNQLGIKIFLDCSSV